MTAPAWDLIMAAIPHRHERLCALLAEFDRQMRPGVGLRIFYDNLVVPVGEKYNVLAHSSQADYLSVFEDDDWPAPDFVERILGALAERPDYVGFPVKWWHNGDPAGMPIEHSLRYDNWYNLPNMLQRDINQFNPIRRELALLGDYCGHPDDGLAWDCHWTIGVRDSGLCRTEVWIPQPMYYYRTDSQDTFMTEREPMAEVPPVPSYPWLTVVTA